MFQISIMFICLEYQKLKYKFLNWFLLNKKMAIFFNFLGEFNELTVK